MDHQVIRRTPSRTLHLCGCCALLIAIAPGCGGSSTKLPKPYPASGPLRTPADKLTAADLDQFLKIVRSHPKQRAPEFTPPDNEPAVSSVESSAKLVQLSQQRFRNLFDPQRQGDLWAEDREWAVILHKQHAAPTEFAALVASVSCAVTRARLDGRADLSEYSQIARDEITHLSADLRELDRSKQSPREKTTARTRMLMRLSRAAALLEYVDLLRQVPQENCALVKEYAQQLHPLMSPNQADPFTELAEWKRSHGTPQDVVPAAHIKFRVGDNRIR